MLLDKKTAIVYGAAGAIGSAVARAYAREGADVHLAGRTQGTLEQVAQRIREFAALHDEHADADTLARGTMVRFWQQDPSMALFVVLSPFVWLDPRLPRPMVACVVVILAVVSLAITGLLLLARARRSSTMAVHG